MIARPISTPDFPPSRTEFKRRKNTLPSVLNDICCSSPFSGLTSTSRSGRDLRMNRCINRVETILPITAPKRPTNAALRKPFPIMKMMTTSPIPNAVPKLVNEINWYFLK